MSSEDIEHRARVLIPVPSFFPTGTTNWNCLFVQHQWWWYHDHQKRKHMTGEPTNTTSPSFQHVPTTYCHCRRRIYWAKNQPSSKAFSTCLPSPQPATNSPTSRASLSSSWLSQRSWSQLVTNGQGKRRVTAKVGRYPILRCPVEDIGAGNQIMKSVTSSSWSLSLSHSLLSLSLPPSLSLSLSISKLIYNYIMHIITYTYIYIYKYPELFPLCYIHIIYLCVYVCTYVRIYLSMYVCIYVSMYLCMHACMNACIYVCMYVSIYLSVYLSIYLFIYLSIYFIYLSIYLIFSI